MDRFHSKQVSFILLVTFAGFDKHTSLLPSPYFTNLNVLIKNPGACFIKLFTALLYPSNLECFFTVGPFNPSIIFAGKAGAYPSGTSYGTPL
jgi:hypothetical protein